MIRIPAEMDRVGRYLVLLGVLGLLFLHGCSGKFSHSLTVSYTLTSKPVQGLPQFVAKAYVDDQLIGFYNSTKMEALPAVPWMEKVLKDEPNFWEWNTDRMQTAERVFRGDLIILQRRYNQTGRLHTWQRRFGCELSGAEVIDTFYQYAYDGKDFISLDRNTMTWIALEVEAQIIKRRWENIPFLIDDRKRMLEKECIWRLQKFVEYGKDAVMKHDAPVVKVTRKEINDEREALVCQVYGFYPKDISTSWKRDGEDWEHETFRGIVAPNSDKTYYAWLSVEIHPKNRSRFHCHVEHVSLPETLIVAWEEPDGRTLAAILGAILGVCFFLVAAAVIVIYMRRHTKKAESGSQYQRKLRSLGDTQSFLLPPTA